MLFDITLHFITHKTAGFCWHTHTEVRPSSIQSNPKTRALSASMPAASRTRGRCGCARIQPQSASRPRAEVGAGAATGFQLNIPPRTFLAVCESLPVRPDVGISVNKPGRPPRKLRAKKQIEFDGQKDYYFSIGWMCYPGNPVFYWRRSSHQGRSEVVMQRVVIWVLVVARVLGAIALPLCGWR
jgi:hypothetical protein